MKVDKIITTTIKMDIDIKGITLLSREEYTAYKDLMSHDNWIYANWWLRSPGNSTGTVAVAHDNGWGLITDNIVRNRNAVRPTLLIANHNLNTGDNFILADKEWTVISDTLAICNGIIGRYYFRFDWKDDNANDYEASDVKKFLEEWAENNNIPYNK